MRSPRRVATMGDGHGSVPSPRSRATWSVHKFELDGRPLVALVNAAYRNFPDKIRFPWCLLVSIPLRDPTSAGLASGPEGEDMERFEQQTIAPLIRAHCVSHFVVRTTHKGHRDLIFYVDDPQRVVQALNDLLESGATRSFTFGAMQDEEWGSMQRYFKRVEPAHPSWLRWRSHPKQPEG
ncbi:MAG: DUF695 domain-containing protein [Chloroflexi bacterium]|nr:DUF695 domain-containing protein [Chloroflexota bacterium]